MNILVLFSAVFLLLVTGVQAQAHRMDGKSLCSSCSVTVNKIAAVLDKQPQLKNVCVHPNEGYQGVASGCREYLRRNNTSSYQSDILGTECLT